MNLQPENQGVPTYYFATFSPKKLRPNILCIRILLCRSASDMPFNIFVKKKPESIGGLNRHDSKDLMDHILKI